MLSKKAQYGLIAVLFVLALIVVAAVINLVISQRNNAIAQEAISHFEAAETYAENADYDAAAPTPQPRRQA